MHVTEDWEHTDSVAFGQEGCFAEFGTKALLFIKREVRWLFKVKDDDYVCLRKTEIVGS